jgi:8-oxo-dGTP pyrophosphatase MutT (NUDIX family)
VDKTGKEVAYMSYGNVILQEWFPFADAGSIQAEPAAVVEKTVDVPLWKELEDGGKRQSAVVLGYTEVEGRTAVICVERSAKLRRHAGQLAFPGGAKESGDRTPLDTAFRECREELGLSAGRFHVKAMLPKEYAYSSDFVIYPFVAFIAFDDIKRFIRPDPVEISSAFVVCTDRLRLPPELFWGKSESGAFMYPVFKVDEKRVIWGATAKILWRFLRNTACFCGAKTCL